VLVPLVAVLLPVAGLLVVLLAVLAVAGNLGVQTAVVHLVVLLEVLPELAVFGASVVGSFEALLRGFLL